jgi:histidyl-tRNA synthetase
MLGGKPAPGIGWALGVERVLDLLNELGVQPPAQATDVYCVVPDAVHVPLATRTAEALRADGVAVVLHAAGKDGRGSMKSQFKRADASGARYALIFGADEVAAGQAALKPLRDAAAVQRLVPLATPESWAHEVRPA